MFPKISFEYTSEDLAQIKAAHDAFEAISQRGDSILRHSSHPSELEKLFHKNAQQLLQIVGGLANIPQIHATKDNLRSRHLKKDEKGNNLTNLTEAQFQNQKANLNKQTDRQTNLVNASYKKITFTNQPLPTPLNPEMVQALEKYIEFLKAALAYFSKSCELIKAKGTFTELSADGVASWYFGFSFNGIKGQIENEIAQLEKYLPKNKKHLPKPTATPIQNNQDLIDSKHSIPNTKPNVNPTARRKPNLSNAKDIPQYDSLIAETKEQLRAYRSATLRPLTDRTSYKNSFTLEAQLEGLIRSRLQASQVNGETLSADQHYINTSIKTLIHYRNLPETSKAFRFAIDNILNKFTSVHTKAAHLNATVQKLKADNAHYQSTIESFTGKYRDIVNTASLLRNEKTLHSLFAKLEMDFDVAIKDFSPHIKGKFLLNRDIRLASFPSSLWSESPYSFLVKCLEEEINYNNTLITNNNKRLAVLQERLKIAAAKEFTIDTIDQTNLHIAKTEKTIQELKLTATQYLHVKTDQALANAKSLPALLEKLAPGKPFEEAIKPFSEPVQQKLKANQMIQKPGFILSFFKESPHTVLTTCLDYEISRLEEKRNDCTTEVSTNKRRLLQLEYDAELIKLKEKAYNYFQRICAETNNLNAPKYIRLLELRDAIKTSDDLEDVKNKIYSIKLQAKKHVDFSFFGLRDEPMSYQAFKAHFAPSDYAQSHERQPRKVF